MPVVEFATANRQPQPDYIEHLSSFVFHLYSVPHLSLHHLKMEESIYDKYEAVIGLEVHSQLLTQSKAFCSDPIEYGALPNTQVGVISLGHPGTLPFHNKAAVDLTIKMGLACNCQIREVNQYARKNYFYADLPKGYQITQDKTPICYEGHLDITTKDGVTTHIGIERIHMEEDSGKSMHDQDVYDR